MWLRRGLVLLMVVFATGCQAPRSQPPMDVSADIRAGNAQFTTAFGAHDALAVAVLYTDDAKVLPPNSEVVVGRAAIQAFWQGVMDAGVAGAALTVEDAVGADSMAIEVGRYQLTAAAGDTIDVGKYIVWWKRTPAGWRLYRDIWNSSRPAP